MKRASKVKADLRLALGLAAGLLCFSPGRAQTAITAVTTTTATESHTTDANILTGSLSSGTAAASATFAATSNDLQVSTFTAGTGTQSAQYLYSATSSANATASIVRRNTTGITGGGALANENGFSTWYANTSTFSLKSGYDTSANDVLLGNNLYRGSDNLFVNNNGQTTTPNQSNIERIDFLFGSLSTLGGNTISAGITANAALALAVFDRGVVNAHDPFHIALITGYDGSGNPNYTSANIPALTALATTSASYGTVNPVSTFSYTLFRDDNNEGNNLATWDANTETSSQGIGGVVFTLADFGITGAEINAGLTIYGYSVMGADVTTTLSNLGGTNYTNPTFYPTASTDASGSNVGGIDLVAVNGIGFTKNPAPEPATYGAWLMGGGLGLTGWRNWRRRRSVAVTSPAA